MSWTPFPILSSSLARNDPLQGVITMNDDDDDSHLDSLLGGLHSTSRKLFKQEQGIQPGQQGQERLRRSCDTGNSTGRFRFLQ
jgi:hypothetical protein